MCEETWCYNTETEQDLQARIRELENYLDEVLKSEDGRIVRAKAILKEFNVGLDRREWVDRALAALEGEMSNKGCRFHCGPDADGRCRDCDSYLPLEEQILISRHSVNRLGDRIERAKAILRPAQLQKDNDRTWYWYRIDEALAALEGK